jgi:hypothetical protein
MEEEVEVAVAVVVEEAAAAAAEDEASTSVVGLACINNGFRFNFTDTNAKSIHLEHEGH